MRVVRLRYTCGGYSCNAYYVEVASVVKINILQVGGARLKEKIAPTRTPLSAQTHFQHQPATT